MIVLLMQIGSKRLLLQRLLSSLECRMSITHVDGRPVNTGYAIVRLSDLNVQELSVASSLLLPVGRKLTLSFELITDSGAVRLSSSRIRGRTQSPPYLYQMEIDISDSEKLHLLHAVNQMLGASPSFVAAVLDSYVCSQCNNRSSRQLDIQT